MAINMTQLTGPRLKKELDLVKASKRYHNKNKSGGNFGIDLVKTKGNVWFSLDGQYNNDGDVYTARISEMYNPGMTLIQPNNYQFVDYQEFIDTITSYIKAEDRKRGF